MRKMSTSPLLTSRQQQQMFQEQQQQLNLHHHEPSSNFLAVHRWLLKWIIFYQDKESRLHYTEYKFDKYPLISCLWHNQVFSSKHLGYLKVISHFPQVIWYKIFSIEGLKATEQRKLTDWMRGEGGRTVSETVPLAVRMKSEDNCSEMRFSLYVTLLKRVPAERKPNRVTVN